MIAPLEPKACTHWMKPPIQRIKGNMLLSKTVKSKTSTADYADVRGSAGLRPGVSAELEFSTGPLFVREDFQAGGPPSGEDGFDEFLGQSFSSHVLCQRPMIINHRNKFHLDLPGHKLQQGIPNIGGAIVLRTPQHSYIDPMLPRCDLPMPFDAGVRGADHICRCLCEQMAQKLVWTGRVPHEFIHLTRRAMA